MSAVDAASRFIGRAQNVGIVLKVPGRYEWTTSLEWDVSLRADLRLRKSVREQLSNKRMLDFPGTHPNCLHGSLANSSRNEFNQCWRSFLHRKSAQPSRY